jgi:hypothetical protein
MNEDLQNMKYEDLHTNAECRGPLTSPIAADCLQHLDADTRDVDVLCRDAEIETLGKVGRVRPLDGGCALYLDCAAVLVERHANVRVTPFFTHLNDVSTRKGRFSGVMGGACGTHGTIQENLKGEGHWEDTETDVTITLEWILGKLGGRVWIGCIWLRIGTSGGLFWAR